MGLVFLISDFIDKNFQDRHWSIEKKWALFDFGLGRKITGGDGLIMKERAGVGFRGSISYASINAHDEKDLSFHDDLWSWMYILIELLTGKSYIKSLQETL